MLQKATAAGAVHAAIYCCLTQKSFAFLHTSSTLSAAGVRARTQQFGELPRGSAEGWLTRSNTMRRGVTPTMVAGDLSTSPVDPNLVAVLFDFDGTVGDTETPAMEVAYWELGPYFPSAADGGELPSMSEFVRDNAGKAFEFMLEVVEGDRAKAGLPDIAAARAAASENPEVMKVVDASRAAYGLKSLSALRASNDLKDILTQQKEETVEALSVVARPVEGMVNTLDSLRSQGIPFAIATTSPKPRVPASVTAAGLDEYFPLEKIHSGESDFDPPRFKPDPSVYLKAASHEGADPKMCVAVEDSLSGVGSAANAEVGLIVGYVGASHIKEEKKSPHAKALMERGARVVISNMNDLPNIVSCWADNTDKEDSMLEEVTAKGSSPYWTANEEA
ncbi:unnamed protein product [Choristocarpus tenellus]